MKFRTKMLGAAVALATGLAAVSSASAAVIVKDFIGGTGTGDTFTPTVTDGGLPIPTVLFKANTYDFVFIIAGVSAGDTTQLQIQAQAQHAGSQVISFDIFSGAPGGGTLVASSTDTGQGTPTNAFANLALGNGVYYLQIAPSQIAVNGEVASGSLIESSVPEPGAWALMLIGVGALGATLRRKRMALAAA